MPLIPKSDYRPPFWLFNGHLQTIIPALIYNNPIILARREKFDTTDGDFVDIDWVENRNKNLIIISHGLEGSSEAPYSQKLIYFFKEKGYDVLVWNFRGCGGAANRLPTFYHSGFTSDLREIINRVVSEKKYEEISLLGVSIGGNITLKYLGEEGENIHPKIKKAVVFSVPCQLVSGATQLKKTLNWIYMRRFLISFKEKFIKKNIMFPGAYNMDGYDKIKDFYVFDNRYTAPMFGFRDVDEYYATQSSKQFIPKISIPTLIVNAANDPFLGADCYPVEEARSSKYVFLETPQDGGHAGFPNFGKRLWMGERAERFLKKGV